MSEEVSAFQFMKTEMDHVPTCYARAACAADPESDGEDIPDPEIVPAFSSAAGNTYFCNG